MKARVATIKDIAQELGVSPSTVSRALKGHYEISEETRTAVEKLAKKLNYQPNSHALSLRSSKTHTIGVVIPEIVHFFFSTVISGIEQVAHSRGYNVIITQSNESYEREVANVNTLFYKRVDGMLISFSKETYDFAHVEALREQGVHVVFFDRNAGLDGYSSVIVDDFQGGYLATKHLLDQGYSKIAHIAGPQSLTIMQQRMNGYKQALADYGIALNEDLIVYEEDMSYDAGFNLTWSLIQKHKVDAIFAVWDMAALGAVKCIKEIGLDIPKDVGVVGFSNWQFTEFTDPSITTVEQPGFEIGAKAAEKLLNEIESDEYSQQLTTLETKLIVRQSSLRSKL